MSFSLGIISVCGGEYYTNPDEADFLILSNSKNDKEFWLEWEMQKKIKVLEVHFLSCVLRQNFKEERNQLFAINPKKKSKKKWSNKPGRRDLPIKMY